MLLCLSTMLFLFFISYQKLKSVSWTLTLAQHATQSYCATQPMPLVIWASSARTHERGLTSIPERVWKNFPQTDYFYKQLPNIIVFLVQRSLPSIGLHDVELLATDVQKCLGWYCVPCRAEVARTPEINLVFVSVLIFFIQDETRRRARIKDIYFVAAHWTWLGIPRP